jgi:hypothetical protein
MKYKGSKLLSNYKEIWNYPTVFKFYQNLNLSPLTCDATSKL